MQINVLLFAAAKEAAGGESIVIEVPQNARASDVMDSLASELPALASLLPSCRLAIDSQYVDADADVCPGNEIALIPPVSGG